MVFYHPGDDGTGQGDGAEIVCFENFSHFVFGDVQGRGHDENAGVVDEDVDWDVFFGDLFDADGVGNVEPVNCSCGRGLFEGLFEIMSLVEVAHCGYAVKARLCHGDGCQQAEAA